MTNKELKEEITRLKTALAELEEKVEALPKRADGGGVFKPEDGQEYWFIAGSGEIYEGWWKNQRVDHNLYAIGNCYPTEQAAEDAVRVLKLVQKARETQNGFVPDWEDTTQDKYTLSSYSGGIWTVGCTFQNKAPIFGYWGNKSACERFINDNHDELIWFFA